MLLQGSSKKNIPLYPAQPVEMSSLTPSPETPILLPIANTKQAPFGIC